MSYKIIVARYNENIDWLNEEFSNCIIYNKGDPLKPLNLSNEIMLNNVGRESETYLNYIITNYNNLPDVIVFTQARISDHRGKDDVEYLLKLKDQAFEYGKSIPPITHFSNHKNLYCWDREWNVHNERYELHNNYKNNERISFYDWFILNINSNYPNPINIYSNGIFAVKRELILKNSIEYYKKLITYVSHNINPAEGHFFERSWYYIFD